MTFSPASSSAISGTSFRYGTPVGREIAQRLGATAELAIVAMVVAMAIALPLGILGALYRGRAVDQAAMTISLAGIAMPNFWLGPLLAIVFSVQLGWLPVSGTGTWRHLVLPALTLGAALAAMTARMTRASLIDELGELYVLAARARGVSRLGAVLASRAQKQPHSRRDHHRPATGLGADRDDHHRDDFSWPGVGRLLIQAISFRDYPLVQGCILLIAVTYVAMNLVVDLLYAWLDPRIRYQ